MDAQAVSAALTPAALAPAIAKRLGLPPAEVETALGLLAQGAQPAFIARYRGDRVKELRIEDLEQIQTAAAQAVGFELRRQQVAGELTARGVTGPIIDRAVAAASHALDLDDLRTLGKRKKRPAAVRARIGGLTPLSLALLQHGSTGDFADADAIPAVWLAVPSRSALNKKRKRKRGKKKAPVELETAATPPAAEEPAQADPSEVVADAAPSSAESDSAADATAESAAPAEAAPAEAAPAEAAPAEAAPAEVAPAEAAPAETAPAEAAPAPEIAMFDGEALAAAVEASALPGDASALEGARSIIADLIAEHPAVRRLLRRLAMTRGKLRTSVVEAKKDRAGRYSKFFDRAETCSSMAPTNVLAIHRAERDGLLHVSLEIDTDLVRDEVCKLLGVGDEGPVVAQLREAIDEAWIQGGLAKATTSGVRRQLKERADRVVIPNLCEALRPQLLAPAFGHRPVLCIDPGTQHGCRLVVLSAQGMPLAEDTVFPLQPKLQAPQAKARIAELCKAHAVELVVVVGSNGARDVEKLAREAVAEPPKEAAESKPEAAESKSEEEASKPEAAESKPEEEASKPEAAESKPETPAAPIAVHTVDSDAVGSVAGSKTLKTEFPKADAASRRAIVAGRRVQDPLLALARADLRKLSLGQHQFEVEPEALRSALDQVVGTSIAKVAVDLNTVDDETLARVPGMSVALAKAVVAHRTAKDGGFRSRNELLEVPGLVGKAFEQSAGFLKVFGGEQPLDATPIHPERYGQVAQMARALDVTVADLLGDPAKVDAIEAEAFLGQPGASGEPLGPRGLSQIQASLRAPGRDPRPPFEVAAFHPGLGSFGDLAVGMELEGVVTHLATFGAFVDVGIAQEGLVHLSEMSHDYVSSAADVVHIGQRIKGKVIEITAEKKRFALSIKALLPAPERPARPRGDDKRRDDGPRGKGKPRGRGGPRGKGGPNKGGGRGREKREEKVLGFRMDLSDLASRLGKG